MATAKQLKALKTKQESIIKDQKTKPKELGISSNPNKPKKVATTTTQKSSTVIPQPITDKRPASSAKGIKTIDKPMIGHYPGAPSHIF